mgnify:CR=1 FL=1
MLKSRCHRTSVRNAIDYISDGRGTVRIMVVSPDAAWLFTGSEDHGDTTVGDRGAVVTTQRIRHEVGGQQFVYHLELIGAGQLGIVGALAGEVCIQGGERPLAGWIDKQPIHPIH